MGYQRIVQGSNRIKLSDKRMKALMMRLDKLTYTEIGHRLEISQSQATTLVNSAVGIIQSAREGEMRLCK